MKRKKAGAEIWSGREWNDMTSANQYGFLPGKPQSVTAEVVKQDESFCAGTAVLENIKLTCHATVGDFSICGNSSNFSKPPKSMLNNFASGFSKICGSL